MGKWEMTVTGDVAAMQRLSLSMVDLTAEVEVAVRKAADEMRLEVRKHARGRPGPRILTSAYTHSIKTFQEGPTTAGAETEGIPYSLRLEFGFVGVDSLGRHYNQPPYPSWRPAADIVVPHFNELMTAVAVMAF
jgi:hypothetical protein